MGARTSGQGRIWPEYWIDCSRCDHHEPLSETKRAVARKEAQRRGWRSWDGKWICPNCLIADDDQHGEGQDHG